MGFTTTKILRQLTGLTTTQISDADLTEIISQATALVNSKINVITTEEIHYIDNVRKNYINGSNTTFYVSNSFNYYFGDNNNDGALSVADISVWSEDSEGTRTELTPATINIEGSFTLSTAPASGLKLIVKYAYTFYNISTPDKLVQLLTSYLAASYSYLQIEHGLSSETKFGNISIRKPADKTSYAQYTQRFNDLLKQINVPLHKPRIKEYKYLI
jgi:hypothetical protein